ncbi:EDR1-related protein [Gimesia sp.]|uniref:EDR1-related protein n=1 Tax=Gimesia sp. TaxID=2024833 RepID=UPI003A906D4B
MRQRFFTSLLMLLSFSILPSLVRAETTLIPFGNETRWRFQDGQHPVPANWFEPQFDDSKWQSGVAPLGYGESDVRSTLSFGSDPQQKPITACFRHSFPVNNASQFKQLVFMIRSDDGMIVYLNGKEIIRHNLPEGPVTQEMRALKRSDGLEERLYQYFKIETPPLCTGANVVAVEVHQVDPRSSDLFLDLALRGYREGESLRPQLKAAARQATVAYHSKHFVGPKIRIMDGYVDGGRGMKLDENGQATSRRELIVVDRQRDADLKQHLEFARSEELKALEPLQRATRLAKYVDQNMSLDKDNRWSTPAVVLLTREYANEGVLLGEVARICGAGVCRHRALLFKLLADEAGLDVALVRGNYGDASRAGGHAWNELYLPDGRRFIIDTMQRRIELLGTDGSQTSSRYLTVKNKPWYPKSEPEKPEQAPESSN